MKKILVLLAILLLVGCGVKNKEETNMKTSNDLMNIIDKGNYIIVDVRTEEEYNESHVKGAINIPYDTIDENVELDKDKKILVYCKSGKRSAIAFDSLLRLGYDVYDMGAFDKIDLEKE